MTALRFRRFLPVALVAIGLLATACNPEGSVDAANVTVTVEQSTVKINGWAFDRNDPTKSVDVHIYIDQQGLAVRADAYRPDVEAAFPGYGPNHGYDAQVNVSPGSHQICVYAINLPGTPGENTLLDCKTVTVSAQPATTLPPTTTPPPATLEAWQSELLDLVNAERSGAGVPAVAACNALISSAQGYATTMADNAWFDTTGPDGSDAAVRAEAYGGSTVAENISFGLQTPAELLADARSSGGQITNLTAAELTHIGMGRATGDPDGGGPMDAGLFWVVDLGAEGAC